MKSMLSPLLALCFVSVSALAQDVADTTASQLLAVQKNLRLMYPKTRFEKISPTPLPGIYEVVMGRNVAYAEESGRFFIFGHLFDMEKQEDLTPDTQAAGRESPKADFAALPLDQAIKSVRGTGQRVMAVFSDPDCPYCKKLEQELGKLTDVTIYTFLMPLDQLHPDARAKADAVWCSKDRAAAWNALMQDGRVPKLTKGCAAPSKVVQALAGKLGINGTPFLIAADGRTMPGAASAYRLSAWLNAPAKPIPAASNAPALSQVGSGK